MAFVRSFHHCQSKYSQYFFVFLFYINVIIQQSIVAAIRKLGGRFLELDERAELYFDLGDKKAIEKVSTPENCF